MTTNYDEYTKTKQAFLKKHRLDRVDTSSMDEYGTYHKEYICEDGGIFYEVMSPSYEKATVTVKGVAVEVEVKLFKTEYWNSDNAQSKFYYEKY